MEIKYTLSEIDETIDKIHSYLTENQQRRVVLFNGKMGAGKTTLIKKLCDKFNVIDEVTSPTFAIINEYRTETENFIYHFDFYRLKNIQEALDIGTEDYFYSGFYCFIEWPDIIEQILPDNYVEIKIEEIDNNTRQLIINSY
ncbi:MAG: tRNA (adenosine(37)-N6)-threonylcarbamoyltransferase complex ATPase subunit type 1 TsaE [Bacteroidales bacterium]|nr:tRNA (adenosine(37)-N6)-threonylcarbamoyltransferase complex ATPase subunit type 1 TsaE [Bacteroidales bacterium]